MKGKAIGIIFVIVIIFVILVFGMTTREPTPEELPWNIDAPAIIERYDVSNCELAYHVDGEGTSQDTFRCPDETFVHKLYNKNGLYIENKISIHAIP